MAGPPGLAGRLKARGRELGFDRVGVAPAVVPPGYARYLDWIEAGREAGMAYLRRGAAAREHPRHVFEGARSVVVAAMAYGRDEHGPPGPLQGKVARYARGLDYHEILWRRLDDLLGWLRGEVPGLQGRAVADTAPLLERDFARLAGLGWIGKNACLIDREAGSFTVLGSVLVDAELEYDEPVGDHCGSCSRCLDHCPTGAFDGPGVLDARRCISYWTIEHKGPIPDEWAGRLDGWAFGCDVCQEVCPWNRKAPPGAEPGLEAGPSGAHADLLGWLEADPDAFRRSIKPTAMGRAKRAGLLRNAALVLGARGPAAAGAAPALRDLLDDPDPAIRGASAWALDRIETGGPGAGEGPGPGP